MDETNNKIITIATYTTLFIWLASLLTPAVTLYGGEVIYGLNILVSGWLGFSVGTFAWFANISFIISIARLIQHKSAITVSLISIALGLTAYSWDITVLDAGGAKARIYGYSIGFYLWMAALFFSFSLNGLLLRATKKTGFLGNTIFIVGLAPLLTLFYWTFNKAIHQRALLNAEEKTNFEQTGTIVKRDRLCSEPIATPQQKFTLNQDTILEIEYPNGFPHLPKDFHLQALMWEVPNIQYQGYVYSYIPSDRDIYQIKEANKVSDFTLKFIPLSKNSFKAIFYKTQDPNTIIFTQRWHLDRLGYCPRFSKKYHSKKSGPRKQVLSAFYPPKDRELPPRKRTTKVRRSAVEATESHHLLGGDIANKGLCSDNIINLPKDASLAFADSSGYSVEKIYDSYFMPERYSSPYNNLLCGSAHVFRSYINPKTHTLMLEKRSIKSYNNAWGHSYLIDLNAYGNILKIEENPIQLTFLKEFKTTIEFKITHGEKTYSLMINK